MPGPMAPWSWLSDPPAPPLSSLEMPAPTTFVLPLGTSRMFDVSEYGIVWLLGEGGLSHLLPVPSPNRLWGSFAGHFPHAPCFLKAMRCWGHPGKGSRWQGVLGMSGEAAREQNVCAGPGTPTVCLASGGCGWVGYSSELSGAESPSGSRKPGHMTSKPRQLGLSAECEQSYCCF